MPWRMLDYLAGLAARERLPIQSVVLYHDAGAGARDSGRHQHLGLDGEPVLTWRYQVIHLWRLTSDDLLATGRPGLVPLLGLTRIVEPDRTLRRAVTAIRTVANREQQLQMLRVMIDLLPNEEMIAMAQQVITDEDREQLRRFPALWREYQTALAEGARQQRRAYILEIVVARFDPPATDYRRVEQALATIDDDARLDALFQAALRAGAFADFARDLIPVATES